MKRNISSWFVAIMTIVTFTSTLNAYEKNLPVGSRAALVSQAFREVKFIQGWLWVQGNLQPTNGPSSFWLEYNSPVPKKDEIRALIAEQQLSYRVMNPEKDSLGLQTVLCSAEGDPLFHGGSWFYLERKVGGLWTVPQWARQFDMLLAYEVPLRVKGAIGARIVVRDEKGNVDVNRWLRVSYDYETEMGTIFMVSEYAGLGERGQLIVTYLDKESQDKMREVEFPFNLSGDGEMLETENGVLDIQVGMQDIITLTPGKAYMLGIQSKGRVGVVPLGELSLPEAKSILFYADTSEGDVANAVRILKLGKAKDVEWVEVPIPSNGALELLLEQGVYHVEYVVPGLRPPMPWNNNGGGGTSTQPVQVQP